MAELHRGIVSADPSHPDATELVELACGELGGEAAISVQHHCQVCDPCARQLRALVGLRDLCGLSVPGEARGALATYAQPEAARMH